MGPGGGAGCVRGTQAVTITWQPGRWCKQHVPRCGASKSKEVGAGCGGGSVEIGSGGRAPKGLLASQAGQGCGDAQGLLRGLYGREGVAVSSAVVPSLMAAASRAHLDDGDGHGLACLLMPCIHQRRAFH